MASLAPFEKCTVHGELTTAGTPWHKWVAKLESLLYALDIQNDARRKALLLHYGGDDIFVIYDSMMDARTEGERPPSPMNIQY